MLAVALGLMAGFGLNELWHARRPPQPAPSSETETSVAKPTSASPNPVVASPPPATPVAIDPAVFTAVKELLPGYASMSLETGAQLIRQNALTELQAALAPTSGQIQELQQRLRQLENSGSESEKQAARQELLRLQSEQATKLGECTAKSSAQIEALQQLKQSSAAIH